MKIKSISTIIVSLFVILGLASWISLGEEDGYFVYLRGKKQYVVIQGQGEPTIVFISGKGRTHKDFRKVYSKLKKTNTIFAYDRAGLGNSELIRNNRTVDTMAYELHELLVKEKLKPPFVLVGQSMGGYIMRCFANLYPEKVSGMVFVEPAHEYEFKHGIEIRSDSDKVVFRDEFKSYLKAEGRTKGQQAESKHNFDFDSTGFSSNQRIVKEIPLPSTIPVTVLIARKVDAENDYIDKEMEFRLTYFEKWKSLNPQTKIISTFKSGHFIELDQPSLVIQEIEELIRKNKN
ncbi:MAG: Prolyl aminopeptidase [Bacteroidota bacterium]|nr:Prolyl aminopeptidase [Bacteroidota bacterium]